MIEDFFSWRWKVGRLRKNAARNVLFLHHSYYHFFYLAKALRRRGWNALTVSIESPDGPHAAYYHGEDLNLHSRDPNRFQRNISEFFEFSKERFTCMHFAGDGQRSFFPQYADMLDPPDIVAWRKAGGRIGYTVSGCNSATPQSLVRLWSSSTGAGAVCDKCVWQHRSDVCS